jgi:hypothetical protein
VLLSPHADLLLSRRRRVTVGVRMTTELSAETERFLIFDGGVQWGPIFLKRAAARFDVNRSRAEESKPPP